MQENVIKRVPLTVAQETMNVCISTGTHELQQKVLYPPILL